MKTKYSARFELTEYQQRLVDEAQLFVGGQLGDFIQLAVNTEIVRQHSKWAAETKLVERYMSLNDKRLEIMAELKARGIQV